MSNQKTNHKTQTLVEVKPALERDQQPTATPLSTPAPTPAPEDKASASPPTDSPSSTPEKHYYSEDLLTEK